MIKSFVWPGAASTVEAGSRIELSADVVSREPDRLAYEWKLITETAYRTEEEVEDLSGLITGEGRLLRLQLPPKLERTVCLWSCEVGGCLLRQ